LTITRPPVVAWVATYSFLMSASWALGLVFGLVYMAQIALVGVGVDSGGTGLRSLGPPSTGELVLVLAIAGIGTILSLWHLIAAFGALRIRNWARYNLIVLALIELPGGLLSVLSWIALGLVPVTVVSALILVYLFRPAVARLFELGLGPATLPVAEADAIERVLGTRRWS
jgi:hypothetical protein